MGASVTETDLCGVLFSTSLSFDISVFEIFTPLIHGGCIIVVDSLLALASAPAREEVHIVNTVPSLLDTQLRTHGLPAAICSVIVVGEPLSRDLAERLFQQLPQVRLLNFYGPTETTVYSTWARVRPGEAGPPSIGRGVWNNEIYILDEALQLVPDGAAGNFLIAGKGVARGYLNRADLTAKRFVENPFGAGRIIAPAISRAGGPTATLIISVVLMSRSKSMAFASSSARSRAGCRWHLTAGRLRL